MQDQLTDHNVLLFISFFFECVENKKYLIMFFMRREIFITERSNRNAETQ